MRNRNQNRNGSSNHHHLSLDITKPDIFRCPISLEIMRSPVSLSTGVTYDRSSIQRWLDSGNTTCPATMQPLPSTDLVPNLTLRRLIHQWSSSHQSQNPPSLADIPAIIASPATDDAYKRHLLSSPALHPSALSSLFLSPETLPLALTLTSLLLSLDIVPASTKQSLSAAISSNLDATASTIVSILKDPSAHPTSRAAAAKVSEMLIAEAPTAVAEKHDLMSELVRLVGDDDGETVDAGLRCLMGVVRGGGRERMAVVRMGLVPAIVRLMEREGELGLGLGFPASVVERGMVVMELVARCEEGWGEICRDAGRCVMAVVGVMMRVGGEGRDAAVGILWRICCAGGGDRKGRVAASEIKEGLGKILVVMQGDCSPAARKMAGDLVRVFLGNDKGKMRFDSKTIHIMPF